LVKENAVQYAIMLAIGSRPDVRLWRNNSGLLFTPGGRRIRASVEGAPDLIGLLAPHGRFLGIECKSDSGKQTSVQIAFQRMIESFGGLYILARSVEDVTTVLDRQK
jgi:hypothetical protein